MWSCPVPYNSYMPPVNYTHAQHASTYASAGMAGLQMAPCNMAVQPLYHNNGRTNIQVQNLGSRRFILDRSLYDLVKTSQYLESTDPKLLCWYLSLSTSDRKLIQDEGGLQQFLQRHPALEVRVREYTCVNFDAGDCYASHAANSSNTRPTLNGVYACMTCGEKLWAGEKCRHCATPIQKETTSLPDRESDLLPNTVTDNLRRLEYCGGNGSEGASYQLGREQHTTDAPAYVQDSFPTAYCKYQRYQLGPGQHPTDAAINSQDSLWTVYNSSHLVKEPRQSDMEAHASKVQLLSQLWDEASQKDSSNGSFVNAYKDPSAQASFSLDVELDSRTAKPELVNRPAMTQAQSGYCQYGETSTVSWTNKGEDDTANATGGEEATSVCESETDHFHSIMEQDESILECKMNPRVSGVNSAQDSSKVMVSIDALMGKTSPEKSAEVKCSTAEKSTSPLTPTATCDVSVMTESNMASCQSVATETMGPDTADKSVNTAVYMSDLDYLMEVFTRLKSVEVEFKELKAKMTRSGELMEVDADAMRCCACADRTKQAELSLLALQYRMCQQHCWRCYYNTAERDWFNPGPEEMDKYRSVESGSLPAKLASVLQTLESDYNEMRCKIQAGATLDQLKPLSVSYTLGTESCYVPAQIIGDTLGSVPTSSSQQPQRQDRKVVGGNGNVHVGIFKSSQEKKDPAPQIKLGRRAGGSVESLLPEQSGTSSGPGDEQTCEFQGMNTSEAWYDAEEDLAPSAERKGVSAETTKKKKDGEEKERGLFLQVSNLPCTVTEADVISSSSSSSPGPSDVPPQPQTSKSNAAVKMIPQQLLRSSPKVKVVCVSPTARCTFVPQHYGTMGSFDTLMARLKERHPGVGSQAIVGALRELRAKHRGVLSGLPLREIENMASELLMARITPP